jgi:hypothetical protein
MHWTGGLLGVVFGWALCASFTFHLSEAKMEWCDVPVLNTTVCRALAIWRDARAQPPECYSQKLRDRYISDWCLANPVTCQHIAATEPFEGLTIFNYHCWNGAVYKRVISPLDDEPEDQKAGYLKMRQIEYQQLYGREMPAT